MKTFSDDFLERVKNGTCGMIGWWAYMDDAAKKLQADSHLANWLAYLDQTGAYSTAKLFRHLANQQDGTITLPNCDPWAYDLKYTPAHGPYNPWRDHPSEMWRPTRAPGKHASEQTLEERRATIEAAMTEVRKAAKHMEMFPHEPKGKHQTPPPAKPKTLDELRQEMISNPPKLSDTLRKAMGIPPAADGASVDR